MQLLVSVMLITLTICTARPAHIEQVLKVHSSHHDALDITKYGLFLTHSALRFTL